MDYIEKKCPTSITALLAIPANCYLTYAMLREYTYWLMSFKSKKNIFVNFVTKTENFTFRFIALPSILRAPHSHVDPRSPFFVLPRLHGHQPGHPGLNHVAEFRRELMKCLAELLLLEDDAVFRSYFEARPLRAYKSRAKHATASRLYGTNKSPYQDLQSTVQVCGPKWIRLVNSLM